MTLIIPRTFAPHNGQRGVEERQVFWHMRNLGFGHVANIDRKDKTDKNGVPYYMWFIQFTTWTAPDEITDHLKGGNTMELKINDRGNFWKVRMYTPSTSHNKQTAPKPLFRLVKSDSAATKSTVFAAIANDSKLAEELGFGVESPPSPAAHSPTEPPPWVGTRWAAHPREGDAR